jgi:hypothetical protein
MNKFNIAWGLLHGGSTTAKDWIRGTSMKIGYNGREEAVRALLFEEDDSIRGWMTEALLQAAIASSRGKEILAIDSLNTYANKLSGSHLALKCSSPLIFVERPSLKTSNSNSREVKYTISSGSNGSYTVNWIASDGSTGVKNVTDSNSGVSLPFFDGKVTLKGIYTASTLPYFTVTLKLLPLINPVEELEKRMQVPILNEPAGEFVLNLLHRNA